MHKLLTRANGNEHDDEANGLSKKELISERFGFLTRSLVKNNVVRQNFYVFLLALEYLSMMYYILRLADARSFNDVFTPIEKFLDVTMTENMQLISTKDEIASAALYGPSSNSTSSEASLVSTTDYVIHKA